MSLPFTIRPAVPADIPALEVLIARSARGLSRSDYSDREIEAAVAHVFGVDSELVADGTYFVVERDGEALACGGWSRRKTLFGGDNYAARESGFLDPAVDAAKIRAFFVSPDQARQGIGRALLTHCENAALSYGFTTAEMMATLPGVHFYSQCGYVGAETVTHVTPDGETVRFMPMTRRLTAS